MNFRRRVAIIGVGNVGSTTAFSLAAQGLANELVLIDSKEKKSEGDAIDLETAADLVRAIFNDERRVFPVSAYLSGQYGLEGLHIGVPALIGAGGVEEIVELKPAGEELAALRESANIIQSYLAKLD
jgi:malate/lactate dehydrogenase